MSWYAKEILIYQSRQAQDKMSWYAKEILIYQSRQANVLQFTTNCKLTATKFNITLTFGKL